MPLPTLSPLYRDLSEWVVLQILDAIRSGAIRPDERLVERDVAARFGVSRAPVRDAFHKLERLDIVERVQPRGIKVRTWTPEDAVSAYLIMDALILMSVQLATPRLTEEQLTELDGIVVECQRLVERGECDPATLATFDMRLHSIIAEATGHRRVKEYMATLSLPVNLYAADIDTSMPPRTWLQIHTSLLDHLKRRDVRGAIESVLRSAGESQRLFMERLEATTSWRDPLLKPGPAHRPDRDLTQPTETH